MRVNRKQPPEELSNFIEITPELFDIHAIPEETRKALADYMNELSSDDKLASTLIHELPRFDNEREFYQYLETVIKDALYAGYATRWYDILNDPDSSNTDKLKQKVQNLTEVHLELIKRALLHFFVEKVFDEIERNRIKIGGIVLIDVKVETS